MHHTRRSALLLAGVLGLSVLSCGREVTGPNDGLVYGRNRIAALNLAPEFPTLPGANAASDLVPFTKVRVVLLRTDGTTAKDTLVDFPSTADSVALALEVPLPLTASDSGITLGLAMAYVNAQGDTVFRAGPQAVTARPSTGGSGTSQPITIPVRWVPPAGSPTPASVTLTPATGSAVAGTTTTLAAVVRDAQGATLTGIPVAFFSLDTTRATVASLGSGVVTWKAKRGMALVVASLLNGPADTSAFDVSLPASLLVPVSGAGQTALIGTALAQPIVWRVVASDSVPVAGVRVDFAVTAGGGSLGAAADTSDANGLVSTPWTLGALVGTQRVTATLANASAATSAVTATGTAPISTQLAITSAPTTVVAGATLAPVTVEVRDAGGAKTPLFTGPVSIALNAGTTGATLGGTTTVNAVAGIATFGTLSIQRVATGLTLTASSGTLAQATSAPFAVTPAAVAGIAIVSGNAQTGTLGQPLADSIVVRVTDAFGNAVPGITVSFAPVTFANSVSPSSVVTDSLGRAKAQWTLGTSVGAHTVRASTPGGPSVDFSATGVAGAAVKLQLLTDPLSVNAAGAPIAPPISFLAVDAVGAVATTFTTPVTLTFAANPGAATLGGRTTATPVNGVITFDSVWVSTVGNGYRFTTTGSGLPSDTTGGIVVVAGAPSVLLTVSGSAQGGTVGTTLASPFVVRVTDAFGNPVAGRTITWSVTGGSGTLSVASGTTNAAGEASTTLTLGATAGTVTVTATAGAIGGSPQTFTASALAGALSQLVITSGSIGTQVAGVALPPLVVEARDALGNVATGYAGTVRALALRGVPGQPQDSAFVSAVAGVATFTGVVLTRADTAYQIQFAADAGGNTPLTAAFTVTPAAPALIQSVGVPPTSGTAGQQVASPFVVNVFDALGNRTPSVSVRFRIVSGSDTLTSATEVTGASGQVQWQPTLPATAGAYTVLAIANGLTGSPLSFPLTVVPGAATQLALTSGPIGSQVVGVPLPDVTVEARDAAGNVATGFSGQVKALVIGTVPDSAIATAVNGVATFSGAFFETSGTYTVTFTAPGLTSVTSNSFVVSPAAAATMARQSAQSLTGTAGLALATPAVVRISDAFANAVSSTVVSFALVSGVDTLATAQVPSDSAGLAAWGPVLPQTPGEVSIIARVNGLTNSPIGFSVVVSAGSAIRLAMVGQPIGTSAATALNDVSVRAEDAFGNRNLNFAEQVTVAVDSGPAGAVLSGGTTLNALGGLATFSGLSLDKVGTYRLRFTTAGLTAAVSSPFTITAGAAATITVLAGDAQTDTAGTALPDSLAVRVTDAGGNVVSGATTTWEIAAGGGALSARTVPTDANGRAAVSWTLGAVLGAQSVTVTVGALTPVTFTATAVAGSNIVTWTGAVSTAWETAGNWDTGTLPTATSPVVIPVGTPNEPVVSVATTIGALTVASEVTVTTNDILSVAGPVDVASFSSVTGSARLELVGPGTHTLRGTFGAVRINGGDYALNGATSIGGDLDIYFGDLSVGVFDLSIGGGLFTGESGTFTMQDTGIVDVAGYVNFFGNSTAGRLTNGTLRVGGDFEQLDSGAGSPEQRSFVASGAHVVELIGTGRQRVRFASPDTTVAATCATSCFATLRANKPSGFILFSNGVKALGDIDLAGGDSISAPGRILVAGGAARLNSFLVRVGSIAWRDSLFVQGEGRVIDSLIAWGSEALLQGVPNVRTVVRGAHLIRGTIQGIVDVTGSLDVDGRARVIGALRTIGSGTLRMTDAGDTLQVDAEANFGGGSTEGLLSAGTLILGGSLVQAGDPRSFYASGTHTTVLNAAATQTLSFANRGGIGAFSHFQELEIAKPSGGVDLPGGAYVMGQLREQMSSSLVFTAPTTQRLVAGGTNLSDVRFDRVQLLVQNGATVEGMQNLTFGTFDPSDIQLFIARSGGAVLLDTPTFETVPDTAQGGAYLYLDDLADNGDTLTVTVSGATPGAHGGAVQVLPDAVLTGWTATEVATWTSTDLTDWSVGANWSTGRVPNATTDVVIPATAASPTLQTNATVRSLTIAAGASLGIVLGDTLSVTGDVVVDGTINPGGGAGVLRLAPETGATLAAAGSIGSVIEVASGVVQLADSVRSEGGNATGVRITGGALDLNGHTLTVEGQFQTLLGGTLRMLSAADTLDVLGDITFAGVSEEGWLTAGEIRVRGWFLQRSTRSVQAFAGTGSHTVRFVGSGSNQNIEFDSPGTTQSRFARLAVANIDGDTVRVIGFSAQARDLVSLTSPLLVSGGTVTVTGAVAQPGAGGGVRLSENGFLVLSGVNQTTCDGRLFSVAGTTANVTPQSCVDVPAPTIVWTGAVNNSWGTAGNWNLNRLPLPTDSVVIAVNDTVTVTTTATVAYITMGESTGGRFEIGSGAVLTVDSTALFGPTTTVAMTGGTLTGDGSVSALGTLSWNGGTMSGAGTTFLAGGATGSVATSAGVTLNARTLLIAGTATLGTGTINGVGTPSIVVNGGGVLQFSATRSYTLSTGEVSLVNGGTLLKTIDAGRVVIEWPVTNVGLLLVQDDTLDLQGLFQHQTGLVQIGAGAALIARGETQASGNITIGLGGRLQLQSGGVGANAGNHIFSPLSSISGQGLLAINSADTTRIQGGLTIDSLTVLNGNTWFESADTMFVKSGAYLGGGFFRGDGVLAITGSFSTSGGNMNGTGTIAVKSGGSFGLGSPLRGWLVDAAGGTVTWGDSDLSFESDATSGQYSALRIRSGGVLSIQHGATNREMFGTGAVTPPNNVITVDTGGTIRKSAGTAISNIRPRVLLSGSFDVLSGTINVQGTCSMSGSKTGSGQLTGNCGTF